MGPLDGSPRWIPLTGTWGRVPAQLCPRRCFHLAIICADRLLPLLPDGSRLSGARLLRGLTPLTYANRNPDSLLTSAFTPIPQSKRLLLAHFYSRLYHYSPFHCAFLRPPYLQLSKSPIPSAPSPHFRFCIILTHLHASIIRVPFSPPFKQLTGRYISHFGVHYKDIFH
jgi:hypothetical protein